jgi:hypothetical protein
VVTEGNWLPGIREFEYKNDLDCLTDKINDLVGYARPVSVK